MSHCIELILLKQPEVRRVTDQWNQTFTLPFPGWFTWDKYNSKIPAKQEPLWCWPQHQSVLSHSKPMHWLVSAIARLVGEGRQLILSLSMICLDCISHVPRAQGHVMAFVWNSRQNTKTNDKISHKADESLTFGNISHWLIHFQICYLYFFHNFLNPIRV